MGKVCFWKSLYILVNKLNNMVGRLVLMRFMANLPHYNAGQREEGGGKGGKGKRIEEGVREP